MVPPKFPTISRADFVKKFVAAGFEYADAHRAYNVVVSTFEDALTTNAKLSIGRVGALVPIRRAPRVIKMGFQRTKEGVEQKQREFAYGEMVRWKFRVYRTFAKERGIDGRIV